MEKHHPAESPKGAKRLIEKLKILFSGRNIQKNQESQGNEEEEIRQQLLTIRKAVSSTINSFRDKKTGAQARPYLPDVLTVLNVPELGDLVSEDHLRDFDIWPSEEEHPFPDINELAFDRYLIEGGDELSLPNDFFREGSYIVLCVPNYLDVQHRTGTEDDETEYVNDIYDITVLYCTGQTLKKLPSIGERIFRSSRKTIIPERHELVADPLNPVSENELVTLVLEGYRTPIWTGSLARGSSSLSEEINTASEDSLKLLKQHYIATARGTVAYRVVRGSVQKDQKQSIQQSLASSSNAQPAPVPI